MSVGTALVLQSQIKNKIQSLESFVPVIINNLKKKKVLEILDRHFKTSRGINACRRCTSVTITKKKQVNSPESFVKVS